MKARSSEEIVRVCHFSDLHLPLPHVLPPWNLLGKRALGFANLKLNRGRTHKLDAFENLIGRLTQEQPDVVVMTGDCTSLAFADEFAEVDRIFRQAGLDPEKTVVVPGNHDRYAVSADLFGSFEKGMADWLPVGFSRDGGYPIVHTASSVAVFGLDTAVWRNPLRAAGYLGTAQIQRLLRLIDGERSEGRWPVMAMHHPPFHLRGKAMRDFRNGLDGVDQLLEALGDRSVTVLHGHLHRCCRRRLGNLDIIGAPSAANDAGEEQAQLAYHVYTFDGTGLLSAEGVRHWPGREEPFERFDLPEVWIAD